MFHVEQINPATLNNYMKEYYYLDALNNPQGPHSLAELAQLMARGKVNPTTLVAFRGGSGWEPLGVILSRENVEVPDTLAMPTLPTQNITCPSCACDLTESMTNYQLPANCPRCGRALRAEPCTIWESFKLALRNYANFSGRATRMEYWSFALINSLLCFALMFVLVFIGILGGSLAGESAGKALGGALIAIGVILFIVWYLAMLVPMLSVYVRRLHDVGWSGWWVLANFLSSFLPIIIALIAAAVTGDDMEEPTGIFMVLLLLSYIASYGLGILLFVLTLLDSQRGTNKYGPSSKYPLG